MEKYAVINRDPFARFDIIRKVVHTNTENCYWCGQNHHNRLFQYGTLNDNIGSRPAWLKHLYCSASCFHSDYNI